uniref:Uncharacterized protein n=1 Tax=Anguilla anguilla TaxID=7936 RepID=A0A0E9SBN3_ANGAN
MLGLDVPSVSQDIDLPQCMNNTISSAKHRHADSLLSLYFP